jgi:3-hydroxyacyl-CoA dehydrogenase
MGAQIAAYLAAGGVRVHLLDLPMTEPPKDPKDAKLLGKNFRNGRATLAIENLKNIKPSPLLSVSHLAAIIPGNLEDDLQVVRDSDWVVEAVVERLDVKQALFKRVMEYHRPGTPITTNTSGINLRDIAADMPEHFQSCFFGTHFFNPPRYMKLLEVIPHQFTDRKLFDAFCLWTDFRLGKGVVEARDTVNFVANRVGVFVNQATLQAMTVARLNIETVDALTGRLMGRPSSATFRTMDVVGLDTFAHVAQNTYDRAPEDPYRDWFKMPAWIVTLIQKGHLGQKTLSVGCYKKDKAPDGKTMILALRPETGDYAAQDIHEFPWQKDAAKEQDLCKRLNFILQHQDAGAQFVWSILRDTFSYVALLCDDIAGGLPKTIDDGMKWGFNWDMGPFELWQGLGYDAMLQRMKSENTKLPHWCKPGLSFYACDQASSTQVPIKQWSTQRGQWVQLPSIQHQFHLPRRQTQNDPRVIMSVKNASLVDIGHDVGCVVFHSRMNALDSSIIEFLMQSIAKASSGLQGLVIGNEGDAFSAGANLKEVLDVIQRKDWSTLDKFIRTFQGAMQMLKFAPFPTVAAVHGLALGGGAETSLHCSYRVAHCETYAGLVEIGVGLLPAGGGTKELALRAYDLMSLTERGDPMSFLQRAFLLIGMARTSTSAHEAIEMGLMPFATTAITLAKDHLVSLAKKQVLHLNQLGYVPPTPRQEIKVLGDPGVQTFKMMLYNMREQQQISQHDELIAGLVARVLCGGEIDPGQVVSEQYLLDLEREGFVELCKTPATAARIEHMLKTGSPLRN